MITSRLTSKAQTTIPQPVRKALNLRPGDELAYRIDGDNVLLTRVQAQGRVAEDPFAAFSEWRSEADAAGYADF